MAVRIKKQAMLRPSMPIAPMIDVVFLLLIYFMVSASLKKQEADIGFQLPGRVEQAEPLAMPDEQVVEIRADGSVVLNDYRCGSAATAGGLGELTAMLGRFRAESTANHESAAVTVAPADSVPQQHVVRVMDACAAAGIQQINFAIDAAD